MSSLGNATCVSVKHVYLQTALFTFVIVRFVGFLTASRRPVPTLFQAHWSSAELCRGALLVARSRSDTLWGCTAVMAAPVGSALAV